MAKYIKKYGANLKVLSAQEEAKENDDNWIGVLFIIGAGITGWFAYELTADFNLHKLVRMIIVIVPGVGVGVFLVKFREAIKIILLVILIIGAFGGLAYWLYSAM